MLSIITCFLKWREYYHYMSLYPCVQSVCTTLDLASLCSIYDFRLHISRRLAQHGHVRISAAAGRLACLPSHMHATIQASNNKQKKAFARDNSIANGLTASAACATRLKTGRRRSPRLRMRGIDQLYQKSTRGVAGQRLFWPARDAYFEQIFRI